MEKKTTHKKKKFVPTAFKFMVAVGSLAGTVGIWNILSNKDLLQASAQNTDPTSIAPTVEQPLPTVAPLMSIDINSQNNQVTATQPTLTVRDVTISTTNQTKSAAPSSSAGITTFSAPAPITTTQTSKKP
jgi:hypothetical protein